MQLAAFRRYPDKGVPKTRGAGGGVRGARSKTSKKFKIITEETKSKENSLIQTKIPPQFICISKIYK